MRWGTSQNLSKGRGEGDCDRIRTLVGGFERHQEDVGVDAGLKVAREDNSLIGHLDNKSIGRAGGHRALVNKEAAVIRLSKKGNVVNLEVGNKNIFVSAYAKS